MTLLIARNQHAIKDNVYAIEREGKCMGLDINERNEGVELFVYLGADSMIVGLVYITIVARPAYTKNAISQLPQNRMLSMDRIR